jgi:hypothetical protein
MTLTVKEHNILKSISIVLIAIGSISAAALSSLPYATDLGVFVAICGALGYPLANALVAGATPVSVAIDMESAATTIASAIVKAQNAPKTPAAPAVDPVKIVSDLEGVVNQAITNYKTQAAGQNNQAAPSATAK